MTNVPMSWGPEEYKDIEAINYLKDIKERFPGDDKMFAKALAGLNRIGRDNARTPVQWNACKHAGFTTGTPWMRVNDNYKTINAASQINDPNSVFGFWKKILQVRKKHPDLFVSGKFELLDEKNDKTFCFYKQENGGRRALVQLNFSAEEQEAFKPNGTLLIANVEAFKEEKLGPWEARIHIVE